jgi:hypothetical protein
LSKNDNKRENRRRGSFSGAALQAVEERDLLPPEPALKKHQTASETATK